MSTTLEQTEMRISPELKIFGDLVSFVNGSIKRIEESDSSSKDVFYNVRCEIARYESIILRSINDNREDLTKINHFRVKFYCELFDMLRERLETTYKNLEAQR